VQESIRNGSSAHKIALWITIISNISRIVRGYDSNSRVDSLDVFFTPPGQHFALGWEAWRDDMILAEAKSICREVSTLSEMGGRRMRAQSL
jgi:hypothetical protein